MLPLPLKEIQVSGKTKVKVITVVQIGNRRYAKSAIAAQEYSLHACFRIWDKYRARYVQKTGSDHEFYWAVRERMARRIQPIFFKFLGA